MEDKPALVADFAAAVFVIRRLALRVSGLDQLDGFANLFDAGQAWKNGTMINVYSFLLYGH